MKASACHRTLHASHWHRLTHFPWTKWPPFRRRYFICISVNEKFCILIKIPLKFVSESPIDKNPATSHYLNLCWPNSLTHICGTRWRWVKQDSTIGVKSNIITSSLSQCSRVCSNSTRNPSACGLWSGTFYSRVTTCIVTAKPLQNRSKSLNP